MFYSCDMAEIQNDESDVSHKQKKKIKGQSIHCNQNHKYVQNLAILLFFTVKESI